MAVFDTKLEYHRDQLRMRFHCPSRASLHQGCWSSSQGATTIMLPPYYSYERTAAEHEAIPAAVIFSHVYKPKGGAVYCAGDHSLPRWFLDHVGSATRIWHSVSQAGYDSSVVCVHNFCWFMYCYELCSVIIYFKQFVLFLFL